MRQEESIPAMSQPASGFLVSLYVGGQLDPTAVNMTGSIDAYFFAFIHLDNSAILNNKTDGTKFDRLQRFTDQSFKLFIPNILAVGTHLYILSNRAVESCGVLPINGELPA